MFTRNFNSQFHEFKTNLQIKSKKKKKQDYIKKIFIPIKNLKKVELLTF